MSAAGSAPGGGTAVLRDACRWQRVRKNRDGCDLLVDLGPLETISYARRHHATLTVIESCNYQLEEARRLLLMLGLILPSDLSDSANEQSVDSVHA
jgi:hypothetical protein